MCVCTCVKANDMANMTIGYYRHGILNGCGFNMLIISHRDLPHRDSFWQCRICAPQRVSYAPNC